MYRVQFSADVTFLNGGRLSAEDFRLDVADPQITDEELGTYFAIDHLGLLMVDQVTIRERTTIEEQHKGSRGGPSDPDAARR